MKEREKTTRPNFLFHKFLNMNVFLFHFCAKLFQRVFVYAFNLFGNWTFSTVDMCIIVGLQSLFSMLYNL
jgi:hypothetical protein